MIYLDTETKSRIDIRKSNVYRYVEDPDFAVLMLTWAEGDVPVTTTTDPDEIRDLMYQWLVDDTPLVAWNSAFDRVVCSAHVGMKGYWDPEQWIDPAVYAAEAGYPRSLDKCAAKLKVPGKDSAGTRLINLFSKPQRDGTFVRPEDRPEDWADFCRYGANDVEVLRDCHRLLPVPPQHEIDLWRTSERINDRGMRIDLDLARVAVKAGEHNTVEAKARVSSLLGIDNPGSVQQLTAGLAATGLKVPNLRSETVERYLAKPTLTPVQREALELRQELALSSHKKFQTGLEGACDDGRVRGSFKFYGAANTGRYSGNGAQPQNLPRATIHCSDMDFVDLALGEPADCDLKALRVQADISTVNGEIERLKRKGAAPTSTLKALVRPLFLGPMTVCDYSSIEARVLAWLAGEQWALTAFRNNEDIYSATAAKMSAAEGREFSRQDGKSATLGLGFSGSVGALRHIGMEGDEEELLPIVNAWRRTNKRIVQFWYDLWEAWTNGGRAGRITVRKAVGIRQMIMPSGGSIWYRGVRWEKYDVTDGENNVVHKEGWRCDRPTGGRIGVWHGKVIENACQRVARDLLGNALMLLDKAGLPVIAHVHDEVLVEGLHPVETISSIMCDAPKWAAGLPLNAAGWAGARYRKG